MRIIPAILCSLCLALAACDQPTDQSAVNEEPPAQTVASISGEEALPDAPPEDTVVESIAADDGSMAEDSPAGEGVTAEELPHSDLPPPSREVFTDSECDFEAWVGGSPEAAEAAAKETGRVYRILKPDSIMTMDHNPERINVVHDGDGKVTRVWCG